MALLDAQRRGQQIGRIRTGEKVTTSGGKEAPSRLGTFRFTTGSRAAADATARLFGGKVRGWNNEWEVITDVSELPVMVPPRDDVISQWYEMWSAGGCVRRCDSRRDKISGGPCLCPHAEDPGDPDQVARARIERYDLAQKGKACKPTSRVSVMIPDLPDLGIWRIDTKSYYAADELSDKADVMQMARDRGINLPAILRIDQRKKVKDGKTTPYPVLVLELLDTARDIVTGVLEAGGIVAQLPPAPGEPRRALTAGQPSAVVPPPRPPERAAVRPATTGAITAQQIADAASLAETRPEVRQLIAKTIQGGYEGTSVCTDWDEGIHEELKPYLTAVLNRLPDDRGGGAD